MCDRNEPTEKCHQGAKKKSPEPAHFSENVKNKGQFTAFRILKLCEPCSQSERLVTD